MTFSPKYESLDAARKAAARSFGEAGDAPGPVTASETLKLGDKIELKQADVDAAHDSLEELWKQVKVSQDF